MNTRTRRLRRQRREARDRVPFVVDFDELRPFIVEAVRAAKRDEQHITYDRALFNLLRNPR